MKDYTLSGILKTLMDPHFVGPGTIRPLRQTLKIVEIFSRFCTQFIKTALEIMDHVVH